MIKSQHGTAGAPILNILETQGLINVVVVVTRYFGGILLGTGGLIRAYTGVVNEAIRNTKIVKKQKGEEICINIEYSEIEKFKYYCKKNNINIIKQEYKEFVKFYIEITTEKIQKFKANIDKLNFKILKIEKIREKYV
ncbi:MAG: DUF1949 domain-containing protein [Clostridia bacterium]|jgi:putative IMPACT (imprinted ancient) family translation regulator|nr:DUF1949 domain-containing protein [Clostridia bacterium]